MRVKNIWDSISKTTDDCWLWRGRSHKGYGRYAGRAAHRVVYELVVGPIPAGLELDHLCCVPLCVNPKHLEPVDRAENMRRRAAKQTRCHRGHEFTAENTYTGVIGHRQCRECNKHAVRAYRQRKAMAS